MQLPRLWTLAACSLGLVMAACGGGGGGSDTGGGNPPIASTDESPAADYAGTGFTVLSRVVGSTGQTRGEVRLRQLQLRDGVWYGVTRATAPTSTRGSQCLQALNRLRITACDGYSQLESATAGASNHFLLDLQTNGAAFFLEQTPPVPGGADTQNRMTMAPMAAGWAAASYAGLQQPQMQLLASKYFVVMDMMAGGLGSTPHMSVIDYGARYNSANGISFPTPSPIDVELFGLANLHTPDYPSLMNQDFANHDGRNGYFAFLARPNTRNPASGGTAAGSLNLWRHDGTALAPMAQLALDTVAKPFNDGSSSYWLAHGVRLVRNAAQPTQPLLVVNDVARGVLDVYRYDGTSTLQRVVAGVVPPAAFAFARAPMVAVASTLYLAAGKSVYRLVGATPTVMANDHFSQGGNLNPFTDVDVLESDGTSLLVGIGREFRDYVHTVADVLRHPLQ